MDYVIEVKLKQIVEQLERIAGALEKRMDDRESRTEAIIEKWFGKKAVAEQRKLVQQSARQIGKNGTVAAALATKNGADVAASIGVYVDAWQARYGTTARPDLSGKMRGLLQRVVTERGVLDTATLLQVFCQMNDPWFVTRRHDLVTFESNIGKIALASAAGHEKTEVNWQNVFGENDAKQDALSGADSKALENVRGEDVPGGATKALLPGVREQF